MSDSRSITDKPLNSSEPLSSEKLPSTETSLETKLVFETSALRQLISFFKIKTSETKEQLASPSQIEKTITQKRKRKTETVSGSKKLKQPNSPKDLIIKDGLTLISHKGGKTSLTAMQRQVQPPQKGGTCWYYAYKTLWNELAINKQEQKKLENLITTHPFDTEIEQVLHRRKIQKIASDLRKMISEIDFKKSEESKTILRTKTLPLTQEELDEYQMDCFLSKEYGMGTELKETTAQCHNFEEFLLYSIYFQSFEEYQLERKYTPSYIQAYKNTLTALNELKKTNYTFEELNNNKFGTPKKSKFEFEHKNQWDWIVTDLLALELGLSHTLWDPISEGFSGLETAIKTYGSIVMAIESMPISLTSNLITDPNKLVGRLSDNNYTVFEWKKDQTLTLGPTHAVVIVGTQQIKTPEGKNQDTILFKDPNDSTSPIHSQKIYRASYEEFVKRIYTLKVKKLGDKREPIAGYYLDPKTLAHRLEEGESINKKYGR